MRKVRQAIPAAARYREGELLESLATEEAYSIKVATAFIKSCDGKKQATAKIFAAAFIIPCHAETPVIRLLSNKEKISGRPQKTAV